MTPLAILAGLRRVGQRGQAHAECCILIIRQPPLPAPIGIADHAPHRMVGDHPLALRIGEDGAEQPHRPRRRALAAAHIGHATLLAGLLPLLRRPLGDLVHEALDILPRDGGHLHRPHQRPDVGLDPAAIGRQRGGLLGDAAPGQQPARLGVLQVHVAEFADRRGGAFDLLFCLGVLTLDLGGHQYLLRLGPRRFWRPGRAMRADGEAALPIVLGAVHDEVADHRPGPPSRAKARDGAGSAVEDGGLRWHGADLAQANSGARFRHF